MRRLRDIRPAGAGQPPRVRRLVLALVVLAGLASPLPARASVADELKSLPADASPKQACAILIRGDAIASSDEGRCRSLMAEGFAAARPAADSASAIITAAAFCTLSVIHHKITQGEMAQCAKGIAQSTSGGGGFDPIGAIGGAIGDAAGGVADAVGGVVGDTILAGFKAIIGLLFGGLQSAITVALVKWITTIPNLSGGHVGDLEASVAVGAGGLLAATMTISIVRFWGAGLTGDGAWAGAEGIARAAVAAVAIGLWPQIFGLAIRASNALQSAILGAAVQQQLKALFRDLDVVGLAGGVLTDGAIPMFLGIVIAVVGILMLLALVAMKIVITALTIVLFCGMPLALVIWPIPELAAATGACLRWLAVALAIPVVWCLVFGAFAAIGADAFSFSNTGKDQGVFGTALNVTVVRPLVAIALLYLALVLPGRLLHAAPFLHGRGSVRRVGTTMAVRAGMTQATHAARGLVSGLKANPQGQLFSTASPMERAASRGAQALRRMGGGGSGGGGRGSTAEASGGSSLRDHSSQAARGTDQRARPSAPTGTAPGGGGGESMPTSTAKRQASEMTGYAALGDEQHASQMERGEGPLGGPRTMSLSPERLEAIARRNEAMAADSASGTAVTRGQLNAAVGNLKSRPDLLEAAQRAAHHEGGQLATAAFAEWSLSDNPHVSDGHRDAFEVLGRASVSERKIALGAAAEGGSGAASGAGGRRVPPQSTAPEQPPVRRMPQRQPGPGGEG